MVSANANSTANDTATNVSAPTATTMPVVTSKDNANKPETGKLTQAPQVYTIYTTYMQDGQPKCVKHTCKKSLLVKPFHYKKGIIVFDENTRVDIQVYEPGKSKEKHDTPLFQFGRLMEKKYIKSVPNPKADAQSGTVSEVDKVLMVNLAAKPKRKDMTMSLQIEEHEPKNPKTRNSGVAKSKTYRLRFIRAKGPSVTTESSESKSSKFTIDLCSSTEVVVSKDGLLGNRYRRCILPDEAKLQITAIEKKADSEKDALSTAENEKGTELANPESEKKLIDEAKRPVIIKPFATLANRKCDGKDVSAQAKFPHVEFENTPHLGVELDNFGPSGCLSGLGISNYSITPVLDYCKKCCGNQTSNVSRMCDTCTPLCCSNCQNMAHEDGLCQVCLDMSSKKNHQIEKQKEPEKASKHLPEEITKLIRFDLTDAAASAHAHAMQTVLPGIVENISKVEERIVSRKRKRVDIENDIVNFETKIADLKKEILRLLDENTEDEQELVALDHQKRVLADPKQAILEYIREVSLTLNNTDLDNYDHYDALDKYHDK